MLGTCRPYLHTSQLSKTHQELTVQLEKGQKLDPSIFALKQNFWQEYYSAVRDDREMRIENVLYGAVTYETFAVKCRDPEILAWILAPFPEDSLQQRYTLDLGYRRLQEILTLPVVSEVKKVLKVSTEDGSFKNELVTEQKINAPLISMFIKIVEDLENRINGRAVERTMSVQQVKMQHEHVVSANADKPTLMEGIDIRTIPAESLSRVQEKLAELRKSLADEAGIVLPEMEEVLRAEGSTKEDAEVVSAG